MQLVKIRFNGYHPSAYFYAFRMPDLDSAHMPPPFYLVGGALCLDLLNTVMLGRDLLPDFASYLCWLTQAGVDVEEDVAPTALKRWQTDSAITRAALIAVKDLREILRGTIRSFAADQPVPEQALAALNPLLARSPVRTELVRREGDGTTRLSKRFRLVWREPRDLLAPVVESAADLFSSADPALIRQCDGADCTMMFLDHTKNHRRRWCSMAACGNRAKVAAHRARRKKSQAS